MISIKNKRKGSVLLVSIFVSALFGAILIGMMQLNTEETMITANYMEMAKAAAVAEAGLNDAYYNIRLNRSWATGFVNKSFGGNTYTVTVSGTLPDRNLVSIGMTGSGYKVRMDADITVSSSAPYSVSITQIRIND